MIGAIAVAGLFALGVGSVWISWKATRDRAFWIRTSEGVAASGLCSLAFALVGLRRLWLIGAGLIVQSSSGAISAIINAHGSNSGTPSAKLLGGLLIGGSVLIAAFVIICLVEMRKYKEMDLDTLRDVTLPKDEDD